MPGDRLYQAWLMPQCGQLTVVETEAVKKKPHSHV